MSSLIIITATIPFREQYDFRPGYAIAMRQGESMLRRSKEDRYL